MNKILAKYRGHLTALTGIAEETMEVRDVEDVLRSLRRNHGQEAEKTARAMLIVLNGESISLLKSFKTVLKDGDVVSFFPVCAGG